MTDDVRAAPAAAVASDRRGGGGARMTGRLSEGAGKKVIVNGRYRYR